MTDKEFEKAMAKCGKLHSKYLSALGAIEGEYERRYGHHPSDVDNDWWIDTFHYPPGGESPKAEEVKKSVDLYYKNSK